ncbi:type VI secretion system baseplate subunit TssE [Azospirillum sp. A1-3]|uniref:type VI secretion system baseplate subunit TssE n=1 Tax=Azospirillum sp. A1-3 TaxID=185874 RepID=UPI00207756CE|nr:type VI secretion system baseplate subunit TssE [Azospirillum sp. A1-3]MCM8738876.1 type VI secretion system baseplate subunit TssE [Azospirillum sp. A1-3]
MAELTVQERLQPSLLDRLRDDEPGEKRESRDRRVLSLQRLRDCVVRDLAWLLNASNLGCALDTDLYPNIAASVLNFGMPPLAGTSGVGTDVARLEAILHDAILAFEPRILAQSLTVRLTLQSEAHNSRALVFDIEGEMWAQPVPIRIFLRTEVDLEVRVVRVSDNAGLR